MENFFFFAVLKIYDGEKAPLQMFDWVLNTILKLSSVFAKKKKKQMLDRSINKHFRTPAFWIVFFGKKHSTAKGNKQNYMKKQ